MWISFAFSCCHLCCDLVCYRKFVMDNWKKVYSNNDTLKVSIPYFWENVDKEGYSVWLTQYKYEDELTLDFMTCNLVGGMMQRLDKLRKNAFASICIFGQSHNMSIRGIWLFRGQQCAFDVSWCTSVSLYLSTGWLVTKLMKITCTECSEDGPWENIPF